MRLELWPDWSSWRCQGLAGDNTLLRTSRYVELPVFPSQAETKHKLERWLDRSKRYSFFGRDPAGTVAQELSAVQLPSEGRLREASVRVQLLSMLWLREQFQNFTSGVF